MSAVRQGPGLQPVRILDGSGPRVGPFGRWAAWGVSALLVAYAVTTALGFLSLNPPMDPIGDPYVSMATGRRAAAVFFLINVLLLPVTLAGYLIWLSRIYTSSRAGGASTTAQGPLSARATMHTLGVRRDQAAYRLSMALPSTSELGVLLAGGPMLLARRPTGHVPSAFR